MTAAPMAVPPMPVPPRDFARLNECLNQDFALLRTAVTTTGPKTRVPSCPDWTVDDLADHVAHVYLHKAESIRLGAFPDPWPPKQVNPDALARLDENFAALQAQFAAHSPADHAATWHDVDQTVGFWIRRMAQETVIHRIDAELAAATAVSPIPDDLALDGIDEHLKLFIAYGSVDWAEEISEILAAPDPRPILVRATTGQGWVLTTSTEGVTTIDAGETADPAVDVEQQAALTIEGAPVPLLRWLWNRSEPDGGVSITGVSITGDVALLAQFEALKTALTQ